MVATVTQMQKSRPRRAPHFAPHPPHSFLRTLYYLLRVVSAFFHDSSVASPAKPGHFIGTSSLEPGTACEQSRGRHSRAQQSQRYSCKKLTMNINDDTRIMTAVMVPITNADQIVSISSDPVDSPKEKNPGSPVPTVWNGITMLISPSAFKKLAPSDRILLCKTVEKFLNDSTIRGVFKHVVEPTPPSPQKRPDVPFRFMALPAEVKNEIVKYALYSPEGLCWVWKSFDPDIRVGTFRIGRFDGGDELQEFNALARVCKQMHMETQGLVFSANKCHFDLRYMFSCDRPSMYRCGHITRQQDGMGQAAVDALTHFMRLSPPELSGNLPHVQLWFLQMIMLEHSIQRLNHLSLLLRCTRLTLSVCGWGNLSFGTSKLPEQYAIDEFMEDGRLIQHERLEGNLIDLTPKWRLVPNTVSDERYRKLLCVVDPSNISVVQGWFLNGL
ncbi:hypothetical protein BDV95DRAFT_157914 [Massariosphaeria phaeospora]|uniref:Uncharacterized protein n=1 Tax=Massariosphaeria phaeospora TaxID=100035 RepID=A0A7C8IA12_9PLEO|nr:hypothetical protein BDV95DRAFT_157914 [Massariosphaeria phaeospora]